MMEKEYRLQRLKEQRALFENKRIALYGTGLNAEAIIKELEGQNIIALIDERNIGKYMYGKKIVSFDTAVFLSVDTIIIAAEARAEREIVKRIAKECVAYHIQLINMYGRNVIDALRDDICQDIGYKDLSAEDIKRHIEENNVICFELMGVLCESRYYNQESLWRYLEEAQGINQFFYNRKQAEGQRAWNRPYDLSEIYSTYLVNTFADESETKTLCNLEEKLFLDSIVARNRMLELFQYAADAGKRIYIVSELPYSKHFIYKLLEKTGIEKRYPLIQENVEQRTFSAGLMRTAMGADLNDTVLYLGRKESLGYFVAKSYGMKCLMVKDAWAYLQDLGLHLMERGADDREKSDAVKAWAVKEYNSPFYQDNNEKSVEFEVALKNADDYKGEDINLIPLKTSENANDYERLKMPRYEDIEVSIVIPVHNQFAYTYACLRSIIANTLKVRYEVIIADDCSTDMTTGISEIVEGIKVVRSHENLFFLKNCNYAAQYAVGKYIVFLNNDTQVCYNWLYPLSHLLDMDKTIGLTGSKLLFPDGRVQEAGGLVFRDGSAANYGRGKHPRLPELNYVREADYISGASIMIRRELWEEIGGFDERFAPAYCEDSDLAFEVRRHGHRVVYQPASEVVHFESVSNRQSMSEGIDHCQQVNRLKLVAKWTAEFCHQANNREEEVFAAKDRKQKRKTVLFISWTIPTYDRDAGSKTIMSYLKLFLKHGYIVKFWTMSDDMIQPYTLELQQMGIEVLSGKMQNSRMNAWILAHQKDIDYAFIQYPQVGDEVMDLLKITSVKIRYYGHDLHYLRLRREYELSNDEICLQQSDLFYEKEQRIIREAEWVYYPSDVEVDIVRKEFGKEKARQMSPYIYDGADDVWYDPKDRDGLMFIGGTHEPNKDAVLWFLAEIYPDIYRERKIPFYLIGADYSWIVSGDAAGVVNVGHVSEDELAELYRKVRMVVVPLRYGAGIKGKVVDAMYHKVPIVSTSVGIEGISEAGTCVKVADDADTFKAGILNLYDDLGKLKEMSDRYEDIINRYFSKEAAWKKIEAEFE